MGVEFYSQNRERSFSILLGLLVLYFYSGYPSANGNSGDRCNGRPVRSVCQ
jgi:hypothetical protein